MKCSFVKAAWRRVFCVCRAQESWKWREEWWNPWSEESSRTSGQTRTPLFFLLIPVFHFHLVHFIFTLYLVLSSFLMVLFCLIRSQDISADRTELTLPASIEFRDNCKYHCVSFCLSLCSCYGVEKILCWKTPVQTWGFGEMKQGHTPDRSTVLKLILCLDHASDFKGDRSVKSVRSMGKQREFIRLLISDLTPNLCTMIFFSLLLY